MSKGRYATLPAGPVGMDGQLFILRPRRSRCHLVLNHLNRHGCCDSVLLDKNIGRVLVGVQTGTSIGLLLRWPSATWARLGLVDCASWSLLCLSADGYIPIVFRTSIGQSQRTCRWSSIGPWLWLGRSWGIGALVPATRVATVRPWGVWFGP